MINIVTLENLEQRDTVIKEYIDEKASAIQNSVDELDDKPLRIFGNLSTNEYNDDEPIQHLYIGVPTGIDLTQYQLKFYRYSTVKQPSKANHISGNHRKYKGLHEICKVPVINGERIPLVNLEFVDNEACDFQKNGYDYYEITGIYNGTKYQTFIEYCREFDTGYIDDKNGRDLYFCDMLCKKRNIICLTKNNKIMSNFIYINIIKDFVNDNIKIILK